MIIEYNQNGEAIADAKAEEFVLNLDKNATVCVSTENVIVAARTLFLERKIPNWGCKNDKISLLPL